MRKVARIDRNQPEIVKALRGIGADVVSLAPMGDGVPDLLVGFRGRNTLLEVKDDQKPPAARKLTTEEIIFHSTWRGHRAVVENAAEAIREVLANS